MSSGRPASSWLAARSTNSIATDSASNRRATNARACAQARSSHCASSTTQTSGRSAATSESRLSEASATRNRSGAGPPLSPNVTPSASRCGTGRPSRPSNTGAHSWCSVANASSRSDSTPTARSTRMSTADAIAYSTSAVFPIPASPRTTSTPLRPLRAASSSPPSTAHSSRRPRSTSPPGAERPTAMSGAIVERNPPDRNDHAHPGRCPRSCQSGTAPYQRVGLPSRQQQDQTPASPCESASASQCAVTAACRPSRKPRQWPAGYCLQAKGAAAGGASEARLVHELGGRATLGQVNSVNLLQQLAEPQVKRIIRGCHRLHRRRDVVSLEIDDGHCAVGSRLVPNHLAANPRTTPRGVVLLPTRSGSFLEAFAVGLLLAGDDRDAERYGRHLISFGRRVAASLPHPPPPRAGAAGSCSIEPGSTTRTLPG